MLERLEELKLLPFVDYLSTVSGGGYIGSWYLSCRKDRVKDARERRRALDHLRQSSNYLAPKTGFFSADTWTIAMVWLRNTILLQTMLVSLFGCCCSCRVFWSGVSRTYPRTQLHWQP